MAQDRPTTDLAESTPEPSPGGQPVPFPDAGGHEGPHYYPHPGRCQRLDLLYYLAMNSRLTLVVSGPEGSGRTTLLRRLADRVLGNIQVAQVQAREGMDPAEVLTAVLRGFDLAPAMGGLEDDMEALRQFLSRPRPRPRVALVIVDDADTLPAPTLEYLLSLGVRTCGEVCRLRLLLAVEPESVDHLSAMAGAGAGLHVVSLTPFSLEHTAHYLAHRLRATGHAPDALDSEQVEHIYLASRGWPGRIDALAREALAGGPVRRARAPGLRRLPLFGGGLVLAVLMAAVLLNQERINAWLTPPAAEQGPPRPVAQAPAPEIPPDLMALVRQPPETLPSATPVEGPAAEAGPPPEALSQEETADQQAAGDGTGAADEGEPRPTQATPTEGQAAAGGEAGTTQAAAADAEESAASGGPDPAAGQPRREDWLLEQDPDHWTIQLLAANNEEALLSFIARNELEGDLSYFYVRRGGKDWYSLLYGVFPSQAEATRAAEALDTEVREPWVRRFDGVQITVKAARRAQGGD
jgi:DamX protein